MRLGTRIFGCQHGRFEVVIEKKKKRRKEKKKKGMHTFGRRVGGGTVWIDLALVKLVIHDDVRLPHRVGHPSLVSVRGSNVGGARDDLAGVGAILVGNVVYGQGVLVVTIADVTAEVLLVGAAVDDALGIWVGSQLWFVKEKN